MGSSNEQGHRGPGRGYTLKGRVAVADEFDSLVDSLDTPSKRVRRDAAGRLAAAAANPNGGAADPAVCSLHGLIKTAMDTFRGPIVAALSLKTPDDAAGDND